VIPTDQRQIDNAYRECRDITRANAKSFYFASHVLPREKRLAAYAVYAFCRTADNTVDNAAQVLPRASRVAEVRSLHGLLDAVYDSTQPIASPFVAVRDTVTKYQIPREYFDSLLRGVEMDLTKARYENFEELREYCYCVASVVGLMMTRVFGFMDDCALRYAIDLGTAMQLTNILRDIREDYDLGRIYIPAEDLERFGYSEIDIANGVSDQRFSSLMKFQIQRARDYYARAELGIPLLADGGSRYCVKLMSTTYARILNRIEDNGYNVFSHRAYVPLGGKLRVAASLVLREGPSAGIGHTRSSDQPDLHR
jgi:phytoene synthase